MELYSALVIVLFSVSLASVSFLCGKATADRYYERAEQRQKEALERQYLRLKTRMDADDPCKPYVWTQPVYPQTRLRRQHRKADNPGMSDELLAQFEKKVKTDGQATVLLNK